jgi:hypothetical protein
VETGDDPANDRHCWPATRLGEAIEALGRHYGLPPPGVQLEPPPTLLREATSRELGAWIEAAARTLALEAEPVEVPFPEVEHLLCCAGPALFHLPDEGEASFLMILAGSRRQVTVLTPELRRARVPAELVRALSPSRA